jgi:hypothetical protein
MEIISTAQRQGNPDATQQDDPPAQEEVIQATQQGDWDSFPFHLSDKADHKGMASMNSNDEIIHKFPLKKRQHPDFMRRSHFSSIRNESRSEGDYDEDTLGRILFSS